MYGFDIQKSDNKAYVMNMYTNLDYRRLGIAYKTLELLVADAKEKGVKAISLEATDMGRALYKKFGFVKMNDEMELPEHGLLVPAKQACLEACERGTI